MVYSFASMVTTVERGRSKVLTDNIGHEQDKRGKREREKERERDGGAEGETNNLVVPGARKHFPCFPSADEAKRNADGRRTTD